EPRRAENVHLNRGNRIRAREGRHRDAGEVDHRFGPRVFKRAFRLLEAGDVAAVNRYPVGDSRKVRERRLLVRKAVYLVGPEEQMLGEMASRESGDAGDEYSRHGRSIPCLVARCPYRPPVSRSLVTALTAFLGPAASSAPWIPGTPGR